MTGGSCEYDTDKVLTLTGTTLRILERLLESDVLSGVRDLALDMYNFYHRQGLGLSWARNIDPDSQLER